MSEIRPEAHNTIRFIFGVMLAGVMSWCVYLLATSMVTDSRSKCTLELEKTQHEVAVMAESVDSKVRNATTDLVLERDACRKQLENQQAATENATKAVQNDCARAIQSAHRIDQAWREECARAAESTVHLCREAKE